MVGGLWLTLFWALGFSQRARRTVEVCGRGSLVAYNKCISWFINFFWDCPVSGLVWILFIIYQ